MKTATISMTLPAELVIAAQRKAQRNYTEEEIIQLWEKHDGGFIGPWPLPPHRTHAIIEKHKLIAFAADLLEGQ